MKYFSFDPNGDGFSLHKTEEEARKAAEDAFDYERGEAYNGWSDEVDKICWGELRQRVTEIESRPKNGDDYISGDCDMFVEYQLL